MIVGGLAIFAHRRDGASVWQLRTMLVLSLVILVVSFSAFSAARDVVGADVEGVSASIGIGLYLVLVGSVVATISSYVQMSSLQKASR